ncbi:HAD family hydrolase [Halobaculum sp. D14]|uniref:HAD family hydrolase n=1 Tax=Halobaculum sp. D14 TaxID=3421642 RepID=UPI003EBC54DF
MATSFDLFGTLVAVARPADPATAVADALRDRDVPVPDDWAAAYREPHVDVPAGAECSLGRHVAAALDSRDVDVAEPVAAAAVRDAFDRPVTVRDGARDALAAAADRGAVGLLSNCSVPGLPERVLDRCGVGTDRFDAVVTSVGCGWRKPDPRAFDAVAAALDVDSAELVHVGDDPDADGGVEVVGGRAVLLDESRSLPAVARELRAEGEP